ncbi:OLC1v1035457C1 [Oldenlandia corymbosa var. corymbosa]|uniref:OLC1v1035457C1 n=1 Tax=Oldenlandia corymbosa var. corymbosa TaxID=529605 RepID=A0AAV1CW62_OLDCO|nr:OLC1v1035457C1 [Oldenlandia corymbosa var. corymbosa]
MHILSSSATTTFNKSSIMAPALVPFLIIFLNFPVIISTYHTPHLCTDENSLLLIQFRQSFKFNKGASYMCKELDKPSYPKTKSWNRSTDCCMWDGVTCDEVSGEIIGLDLSCSQLQGSINSNSTIFHLSHLQSLDLAHNDFMSSPVHSNFAGFRRLAHLNLSDSVFSGSAPLELSYMLNLVTLDLSLNENITVEPQVFELLLQNLTHLRELSLEACGVNSKLPRNLSASVEILNLASNGLFGDFPGEIFQLPKLQVISLSANRLSGRLLKVNQNISSALHILDLSYNNFSGGELHESVGNLKSFNFLVLKDCNFSGPIPESFGNLTELEGMYLSGNSFTGHLPPSIGNLEQLAVLLLYYNRLEGQLPDSLSNLKSLTNLDIRSNLFNGYFPSTIFNLTKLEHLDFSDNSLKGPLPPNITGLPNLSYLDLSYNSINGTIPS